MLRTSALIILGAVQTILCGAWTLDTSASRNSMGQSTTPTDDTLFGAIAEMDIKVVITLSETMTLAAGRQWIDSANPNIPNDWLSSTSMDAFCVAIAVNINAVTATNQSAIDIMHWSNASKSLDVQLRYLAPIEDWIVLQVHTRVGDGTARAIHVLGPPFRVHLAAMSSDVALLWLTVWLTNAVDLDQHEMHVWQLQPAEQAWVPVLNYASLAIQENPAPLSVPCWALTCSEAVFTVHNFTAASVSDSSTCISTAIASETLVSLLPASMTTMQLTWSQWQISGPSVWLDGQPSGGSFWRSWSQFTVGQVFTFTDRLLSGITWALQVCVCRPLICTFSVEELACNGARISTVLFVFSNATGNCDNTTCYFIDNTYAMLEGDMRLFGYVAANGATYRGRTVNGTDDFIANLQTYFQASNDNTLLSQYECGAKSVTDGVQLPQLLFDQRACPELNVLFDPIDGFPDGRRRRR